MVHSCCAYGCAQRFDKDKKISFFKFPLDEETKTKWIAAIKRKNFNPSKFAVVCSKHFKKEDLLIKFGKVSLKNDAVPSIFDLSNLSPGRKTKKIMEQPECIIPNSEPAATTSANITSTVDSSSEDNSSDNGENQNVLWYKAMYGNKVDKQKTDNVNKQSVQLRTRPKFVSVEDFQIEHMFCLRKAKLWFSISKRHIEKQKQDLKLLSMKKNILLKRVETLTQMLNE